MPSTLPSNADRGYSLVELLVATTIMLSALATASLYFVSVRNGMSDESLRVETQQGLRAAIDSMARDLRLGGACLPLTGDFITLDGTNASTDAITTRTGLVRPNETCISTVTTIDLAASATSIPVQSVSGFTVGVRAYIIQANQTSGEVFTVTGVDTGTNTLTKAGAFSCGGSCANPAYPTASGVYALDERTYAVDTTNPALPALTVAANGGAASPLVLGIENLQLKYQLARNCETTPKAVPGAPELPLTGCDVVDLPSASDFALVNTIYVTLSARSPTTLRNAQYFRMSRTVAAKPRNLLPNG